MGVPWCPGKIQNSRIPLWSQIFHKSWGHERGHVELPCWGGVAAPRPPISAPSSLASASRKLQRQESLSDLCDHGLVLTPASSFPGSSAGKESACNSGDPSSIPRLGRSPGEGIGYPVQYSWALLVAQIIKNLPAMWESWVWSLGWEDPLEKGKVTHFSILAWRIPWTLWSMGLQRWTRLSNFHFKVCPHSTHRGTFWIMWYLTQLLES